MQMQEPMWSGLLEKVQIHTKTENILHPSLDFTKQSHLVVKANLETGLVVEVNPKVSGIWQRALVSSIFAWEKLPIEKIRNGLEVTKHGQQSLAGCLGKWNATGLAKKDDRGQWMIIDIDDGDLLPSSKSYPQYAGSRYPLNHKAIKKRARQLADRKKVSYNQIK